MFLSYGVSGIVWQMVMFARVVECNGEGEERRWATFCIREVTRQDYDCRASFIE